MSNPNLIHYPQGKQNVIKTNKPPLCCYIVMLGRLAHFCELESCSSWGFTSLVGSPLLDRFQVEGLTSEVNKQHMALWVRGQVQQLYPVKTLQHYRNYNTKKIVLELRNCLISALPATNEDEQSPWHFNILEKEEQGKPDTWHPLKQKFKKITKLGQDDDHQVAKRSLQDQTQWNKKKMAGVICKAVSRLSWTCSC